MGLLFLAHANIRCYVNDRHDYLLGFIRLQYSTKCYTHCTFFPLHWNSNVKVFDVGRVFGVFSYTRLLFIVRKKKMEGRKETNPTITEMENLGGNEKNVSLRLTLKFYEIASEITLADGTRAHIWKEPSKTVALKMKSVNETRANWNLQKFDFWTCVFTDIKKCYPICTN